MRFKNVNISQTKEVFYTKFKVKTPRTLIIVNFNFLVVPYAHARKLSKALRTCLKLKSCLFFYTFPCTDQHLNGCFESGPSPPPHWVLM